LLRVTTGREYRKQINELSPNYPLRIEIILLSLCFHKICGWEIVLLIDPSEQLVDPSPESPEKFLAFFQPRFLLTPFVMHGTEQL
jgi:hypothetical protein